MYIGADMVVDVDVMKIVCYINVRIFCSIFFEFFINAPILKITCINAINEKNLKKSQKMRTLIIINAPIFKNYMH